VLQQEKTRRDELHKEKDKLQGQVAELGGMVKSQQRLLELEKVRPSRVRVCVLAVVVLELVLAQTAVVACEEWRFALTACNQQPQNLLPFWLHLGVCRSNARSCVTSARQPCATWRGCAVTARQAMLSATGWQQS
jgi:hypothetical protein